MFYLCYICNRNSNAAIAIFFLLSSSSKLSDIIVCFSHFGLIVINCPVFGVMIIFNYRRPIGRHVLYLMMTTLASPSQVDGILWIRCPDTIVMDKQPLCPCFRLADGTMPVATTQMRTIAR